MSHPLEPADRLPFGSAAKARRYDTDRYLGAVGLNWYSCDPSLQFVMKTRMSERGLEWATPHLERIGALMGGPIAERAEETDRNPPRLERYDRWGHDVSRVVMPPSFEASKADLVTHSFSIPDFRRQAAEAGAEPNLLGAAWAYMLDQAEIGMMCALGTGGDMVVRLSEQFAPDDVRVRVRELLEGNEFGGETSQMFTERTGGSDLATLETTATPAGDAWLLNGFKWFASNANGSVFVVLAKPEGAPDSTRGIVPFLVLRERRDGSANGVRIRRLKDKLGTKAVASAEVEFVDAEAFMLAPVASSGAAGGGSGDGRGLARMMELTNGARLGIAMMGLGCARRSLVEAICYTGAREAFGAALIDQPLVQRKLAELMVEVEAAQALVFEGYAGERLRLGAPLAKLRAARLGITAASDAIDLHGGNGYIEQWPMARILRDAQVNTIWEGPDNILCLDVRRAIEKDSAHLPWLDRVARALEAGADQPASEVVRQAVADFNTALETWRTLSPAVAEARLFELAGFMVDIYAGALLVEQAGVEARRFGGTRKALVADLYARRHLRAVRPDRGIGDTPDDIERFKELLDGCLIDQRA
jgi:alkylation response protein AidB-like acyl-CoA dehydrogenase